MASSDRAADVTEKAARSAADGAWKVAKAGGRCAQKSCACISNQIKKLSVTTVATLLRVFNLVNAVLLGVACYFAFTMVSVSHSVTQTFLAVYIGVFAILLCAFELRVKWTEPRIRRSFGFMFTYTGRAVFLIFLGAIAFGMLDSQYKSEEGYKWCLGVGVATVANAIFNCFIICSHPQFQELSRQNVASAVASADPSRLTEEQIKAYLRAHPEVAAAAMSSIHVQPGQPATNEAPMWSGSAASSRAPTIPAASAPSADVSAVHINMGGSGARSPTGAYAPPAAAPAGPAHVIADEEDNPFASDNPFDKHTV